MHQEGSDHRSGPSSPSADIEEARRRLYRRHAVSEDVGSYNRLLDVDELRDVPEESVASEPAVPPTAPNPSARQRLIVMVAVAVVVIALIVVVLLPSKGAVLHDRLEPPAVAGRTLVMLSRDRDPRIGPTVLTYQPAGYTVFQPDARTIFVALRCEGTGTVAVGVDRRFFFHCGPRTRVLRQSAPATGRPFLIVATTRGDVVWGARIAVQ